MDRRGFLKLMGTGTGAALFSSNVVSALAEGNFPGSPDDATLADSRDAVSLLLNRVAFGPCPGQVDAVKKMGVKAYLEQQLNPEIIDDTASEKRLGDYISLDMSFVEMYATNKEEGQAAVIDLDAATIMRAIYSERQLFEVVVGFWSEHFSIYHQKGLDTTLKTIDDREAIRKNAMGTFRDLLFADAKSPAMLIYLDQAESNKTHPNENYAREVMELHTLTIGNYTETDVKEVARCFTGWTIQGLKDPNPGEAIFRPALHDNGPKTVLGHQIPAGGGEKDMDTVLDILATHPATSKHIASKLCRRFIADNPPDSVVNTVADTFIKTKGDVKSMLRTIFASPEFLNAPPKFKRPWEYLISLFRAFDVQVKGNLTLDVIGLFKNLGQLPFDHITPDGYTDHADWWQTTLLTRWNIAIRTVYGQVRGMVPNVLDQAQKLGGATDGHTVLNYFAQLLYGRALTKDESDTLWALASKKGEPQLNNKAGQQSLLDAIAVMAASPTFMFR